MGKSIPGNQAQQFTVSLSKGTEGPEEGFVLFPANDRHIGRLPGFRGQAAQASGKSSPASLCSVMVAHDSMRHRQQPCLGHVVVGNSIKAPPRNREYLGGGVLGVGLVDSSNAVSKDIGVMPLKEIIEAKLGIRGDGYDIP